MSSAEKCLYVAVWEISPWGKNGKFEHVFACTSKSVLCPTQLHFAELANDSHLADDLPRIWENHSKTHQVQPIPMGGAKQSVRTWRVCDDTSPAEVVLMPRVWVRVSWCESCCNFWMGTIKFTLSPSLLGEPVVSISVWRYCLCSRDYRCSVKNSGDRMTEVNKDMKPQVCHTYTQSLVFLTPSSCWNWSAAHLIFHCDCCWQKTGGDSSRYLSDNPLSGEGRFVWGCRACDRGINVEHRYPDISGRCL